MLRKRKRNEILKTFVKDWGHMLTSAFTKHVLSRLVRINVCH